MRGATQPCPVPGCSSLKRSSDMMCLAHWRRVPKILQQHVYSTWRSLQDGNIDAVRKYREARAEAIRVAGLPK